VRTSPSLRVVAVLGALALAATACGSSDGGSSATATTAAPAAAATTAAAAAATTAAAASGATTTAAAAAGGKLKHADESLAAEQAGQAKPMKATGDPIVIGLQNPEGDPAGTFPEYTFGAEAAVEYINEELGGVGADYKTGKPGRPLKLEVCKMAITPADSQKCANELASKKPFLVLSSLNFFGNHFAIYNAAKVPVLVGTPITALDFTSPGVYAVGGGGGCLGAHTALIKILTKELKKKRIAIPWADTPPGVFCYHDLEKKPLEVLAGKKLNGSPMKAEGNANLGSIPDLQHIGVPVKAGLADVTPQATQVLDFKPDGIGFSAQGADCWTFVNALAKLGWKQSETPLVMTGSCIDFAKMTEAGDTAKGLYFVGNGAPSLLATEGMSPQDKHVADTYQSRMVKYAEGGADTAGKGFATQGFTILMQIWDLLHEQSGGDATKIDVAAFTKLLGETDGRFQWGGTGLDCAGGRENAPYVAVCNSTANMLQWDGKALNPVASVGVFSALDLIKGTELDFGK
jgi:branched-chain amino acid transport system substrate-binding protein